MHHRNWPAAFAFAVAFISGAYLCTLDAPRAVIGAVVLVLCFLTHWGFDPSHIDNE